MFRLFWPRVRARSFRVGTCTELRLRVNLASASLHARLGRIVTDLHNRNPRTRGEDVETRLLTACSVSQLRVLVYAPRKLKAYLCGCPGETLDAPVHPLSLSLLFYYYHARCSFTMAPNMSLFSINAILILTTDDKARLLAKYYTAPHPPANADTAFPGSNPYPTLKEQKAFEKGLTEKTMKSGSDVILYDNRVVVFKMEGDVMLYVVGGPEENEILLFSVVLALRDSLAILLK